MDHTILESDIIYDLPNKTHAIHLRTQNLVNLPIHHRTQGHHMNTISEPEHRDQITTSHPKDKEAQKEEDLKDELPRQNADHIVRQNSTGVSYRPADEGQIRR